MYIYVLGYIERERERETCTDHLAMGWLKKWQALSERIGYVTMDDVMLCQT